MTKPKLILTPEQAKRYERLLGPDWRKQVPNGAEVVIIGPVPER